MSDKTYNGWSNYETWNVKLWIDNDGSNEYWDERATEMVKEDADSAVYNLSKEMEEQIEGMAPDLGASMFSDLLTAALSEVNWYEIAEHIVADVPIEEEEATK